MGFLSDRWIVVVKLILQPSKTNDITFTMNMSAVINTSWWSLIISLGIYKIYPVKWIGLFLFVLHFKDAIFLPQIACAMYISWTVTGKYTSCWV